MKVTEKQLSTRVQSWVESLPYLGLGAWTFSVEIVEDPSGHGTAAATVACSADYDLASMEFAKAWLDSRDGWDDVDPVIIHELFHVLFRDYDHAVAAVAEQLAPAVREMWEKQVEHELEGVIERMTMTLWSNAQS